MIFKAYYSPKTYVSQSVVEELFYFNNMDELIDYMNKCGHDFYYAKEVVGVDQINEFEERYMR